MALHEQFLKVGEDGTEFRGVPFWSLNDDLDPAEITRQIEEMAKAGLGGHFMHSRIGLITPYMSDEWMKIIQTAITASAKSKIKPWLYDEDRWPSGFAGGHVPALGEEYVAKRLRWEEVQPGGFRPHPRTISTFIVRRLDDENVELRSVEPKLVARKAKPQEMILHFYYDVPNYGFPPVYADLLNAHAVKEFIHHTYDGYRKRFGKNFGRLIPGIFTDEPQYACHPWSTELAAAFKKMHRYELLPSLPMLIKDIGDFRAFRYDYWRTVTQLFVDSFMKQLGDWCRKHGIKLTGHVMCEDHLVWQLRHVGAAMPHYEHMHIPGIDMLCRDAGNIMTCKQVSSVAHQFGGRRVLSEMFGGAGWNTSFEDMKWMAESQIVLGIDLICQHLSQYSLHGCRKRDYPPSLHYQQPWWPHYKYLNDYFARLTFMMTRGQHVANVLVLHSMESAWAAHSPTNTVVSDQLNSQLMSVMQDLLGSHIDFDLGDETLIAKYGHVAKHNFAIKSCEYSVIVIPPCLTIRETTLKLIERFMRAGGTVILTGEPPQLLDGRRSDRPAEVLADAIRIDLEGEALAREVLEAAPSRIQVLDETGADAADIFVHERDDKATRVFFLANRGSNAVHATIRIAGGGRLERWDCETGDAEPLATKKRGKQLETKLLFEPRGSHLLVLHTKLRPKDVRVVLPKVQETIELAPVWSLERTSPNALTLDYCSYRVARGEWSPVMPVLSVQEELKKLSGTERCEFKYQFDADFTTKLPAFIHLAIEDPQSYEIKMNGVPVPSIDIGWWRDISFRRIDVTGRIRPQSRNEIVLRRTVAGEMERRRQMAQAAPADKNRLSYGVEIESIYLLGDFTVRANSAFEQIDRGAVRVPNSFVVTDKWSQATFGNLVEQGLPFYAGSVKLTQTIFVNEKTLKRSKGARLTMPTPDTITMAVRINGKDAAFRAWRPFEAQIHEFLVPGRNEISFVLTNSCRNLLGPHHHADGELHWVSPGSFLGETWDDRGAVITWTDAYSFVKFGLNGPIKIEFWK